MESGTRRKQATTTTTLCLLSLIQFTEGWLGTGNVNQATTARYLTMSISGHPITTSDGQPFPR